MIWRIPAYLGNKARVKKIIINQTQAGTSADQEGYFNLINVSPGTYSVRIMMIGYESVTIENVIVETKIIERSFSEKPTI